MRFCFFCFFLVSIVPAFTQLVAVTDPPQAPEKPHEIEEVGKKRNDPFFWLRDRKNPEVLKYLESENRYTEKTLRSSQDFQEALYKEMRARIKEEDLSVPERIGDFYYYARTETGKQYLLPKEGQPGCERRSTSGREPARPRTQIFSRRVSRRQPRPSASGLLNGHQG
jgi:Prolyl oligopeptidase, N-terminal beta-propeller domain